MEQKRKISIRKILQVVLTIVVSTCCVIAMVSASNIEGSKYLTTVAVHIKNDKKYHFIQEKEIMDLAINNRHVDVMHTQLSQLDVHGIEQVIKSDPWVAEAQAYIDIDRVLHMYVVQRIPVARIFEKDSKSYYMDATLHVMPLSPTNIYYTTVVTNVPDLSIDSTGLKGRIYSLVKTIQADTFWNAQISQVIVDSAGLFELTPVIGNQRILFGDTTDRRAKLDNLFAFYKNVLNRIGWDKYETLDLRFKGQVVASPSLPYKGPVDRAIDKMNWINSIVITEAQNDTRDSINDADISGAKPSAAVTGAKPSMPAKAAIAKTAGAKVAQGKDGAGTVAKVAVAAGGVAAGVLIAKKLKDKHAAKEAEHGKQKDRFALHARQKPVANAPSAPFGKGTVKAQPVAKGNDKQKHTGKATDKKKEKETVKKTTAKKATAKKAAGKPVLKKGIKHVDAKKLKKVNNDKNKKKDKHKTAVPGNKKH